MDRTELKSLIIKLREEDGLSFGDISKTLLEDYGVERTRQAISTMYARTKVESKESVKVKKYSDNTLVKDIINLAALGYRKADIINLLKCKFINLYYNKVSIIIDENQSKVDKIKDTIISKIVKGLSDGDSMEDILGTIGYGDVKLNEKVLIEYFGKAYAKIINNNIRLSVSKAVEFTGDKNIVNIISESLNDKVEWKDIKFFTDKSKLL